MELEKLIDECHKTAVNKGWWVKERDFPTIIMLVVTELAEAVQEDRKITNDDIVDKSDIDIAFNTRYDKTEVEVADALIRLFDLCGAYFPDIEKTILEKMEINRYRPYKHNRRY